MLLPRMRDAGAVQRLGEVDRRLAAELDHDAADACSSSMIASTRLLVERLEVQARAAVEVGAHRLRVAVDHDRVDALRAQRHRGVHAAVVELDALADADRAAAEDHHGVRRERRGGRSLVLVLVGRVVVGRGGFELRRARVDALEDLAQSCGVAARANALDGRAAECGDARIGQADPLRGAKRLVVEPLQRSRSSHATMVASRRRNHDQMPLRRASSSAVAPPRSASSSACARRSLATSMSTGSCSCRGVGRPAAPASASPC